MKDFGIHHLRKKNVGVRNLSFQGVVGCEVDNFELWKLSAQAFGEPFRRDVKLKAMLRGDEKLHMDWVIG